MVTQSHQGTLQGWMRFAGITTLFGDSVDASRLPQEPQPHHGTEANKGDCSDMTCLPSISVTLGPFDFEGRRLSQIALDAWNEHRNLWMMEVIIGRIESCGTFFQPVKTKTVPSEGEGITVPQGCSGV
jgi:hypothetical protein